MVPDQVDGFVPVDKPTGMTSHDVVDVVRRKLGTRRVGHAGTLDPDASGVLLIGVGRATRLLQYAGRGPKRYTAVASFGATTSTQDASGEVLARAPASFSRAALESVLETFVGETLQLPPMVSAVKVGGERLYRKARRGEEIVRRPRPVSIHALELVAFHPGAAPQATFDVTCSAGTYVRTLVHDIGQHLGCGAHLAALRRTEAGGFTEAECVPLDELMPEDLLPLAEAVRQLPRVEVDDVHAALVADGRRLESVEPVGEGPVAITLRGELLAVYRPEGSGLRAERVVAP